MLAVPVGLLASAILVVNNVRDLETDRRAGKRTLAVRLGRERTRVLYVAMVGGAFVTAQLPWLLGSLSPWLLLSLLAVPLARARRADGAHAHGRPGAQRRARRGRASSSSRSALPALGGHPRELMRLDGRAASRCRFREPLRAAWGVLSERELLRVRLEADDGLVGRGEAAPLEPYDGVALAAVRAALDAYAEVLADCPGGRGARGLPRRARPAAGARRRRPRAVGPRRPALRAPGGAADLGRGGALDPGQRDDRRRGPRGRGGRGRGGRAGGLRHGQGQGRRGRRRGPARRRARRGRAARRDPRRRQRRLGHRRGDRGRCSALAPAGIELAEEPVHGVEPLRAVRAAGRRAARDGRDGGRGGRRGLGRDGRRVPEDRPLRRHHRRAARRRGGARRRLGGLPRLDLRRPAGDRRRGPRRGGADRRRAAAGPRPRDARRCSPSPASGCAPCAARSACPPSRAWGSEWTPAAGCHDVVPRDDRPGAAAARRAGRGA